MRVPDERDGSGVGRELAVDQIEAGRLAGAVGPISATSSPAATSNETSRTASTPPKDFDIPFDGQHRIIGRWNEVQITAENTAL